MTENVYINVQCAWYMDLENVDFVFLVVHVQYVF